MTSSRKSVPIPMRVTTIRSIALPSTCTGFLREPGPRVESSMAHLDIEEGVLRKPAICPECLDKIAQQRNNQFWR